MAIQNGSTVTIRNIRIGTGSWRNFSGEKRGFNPAGRRNFCAFIDNELAAELDSQGWPVRYTKPNDYGESAAFFQVNVNYGYKPPKIQQVTSRNKVMLNEDMVGTLDDAEIASADITLSAHPHEAAYKGATVYLKTLVVRLEEDELLMEDYGTPVEEDMPF